MLIILIKARWPRCKQSNFAPLDRKQLEKHWSGNEVIGLLYPLIINDTCCLLAIEFWRDIIKVQSQFKKKKD